MERDIAKVWKEQEVTIALYGFENQSQPEKIMPIRVLGYDGAMYRSQLLKNKKEELKEEDRNRSVKDLEAQQLYPVVTIVLHFGLEHWNQPKNLKEVVRIPKVLDPYVNDYKHVDAVLKLLSVFGGIDQINETITVAKEKEGKDMSYQTAFERIRERWKDDTRASDLLSAVENLQKNVNMSLVEALNALGKTMEDYEKAKELLENED